ncbi:MAG: alpha/beta hydrolase [Sedimentisphaerales bacterium]|nr:alpha/beta hydrolase [Sedimentisphaerales bacterium]
MKLNDKSHQKHFKTIIVSFYCITLILSFTQGNTANAQRGTRRSMTQTEIQDGKFSLLIEEPVNGSIKVNPPIPDDGRVTAGTVITLTAIPDKDYALDSCYYFNAAGGMFGRMNIESMEPTFEIVIDQDKTIGASFIEEKALEGFKVIQNVVYAQPGVKKLKYDVFSPNGAQNLPCIVIIHGGGWSSNTEDIMRGLARELVRTGDYVVTSIDYRWIRDQDGDEKPNTMANLIEDVYGAIAHIQEHAKEYGANPTRIAVTGDSAGGHLSAAAINMVDMIGGEGFGIKEGIYQYKPTYIPKGKTVEQVRKEIASAIKAAAPSYGVFNSELLRNFAGDAPESALKAISPVDNIPNIKERAVPQFLTRGTNDPLIQHEPVQEYTDALKAAGQTVEYIQVEGASHAFFDWKPDALTKATFAQYGVPYAAKMKDFFNAVFYPEK